MARQFQFRFMGTGAPDGELEAGVLIALVRALRTIAHRLGRQETDSEQTGRFRQVTKRVVTLSIGLHGGGTRLTWRRMPEGDSLGFSMPHESAFDDAFEGLIMALAESVRPGWVDDALAESVDVLRAALTRSAETVRFLAGDHPRTTFCPGGLDPHTWMPSTAPTAPSTGFPDAAPGPEPEEPAPLSLFEADITGSELDV